MRYKSINVSLSGRKSKGILVADVWRIVERRSKEMGSRANFRADPRIRITSSRGGDRSSSHARNGKAGEVVGIVPLDSLRLFTQASVSDLLLNWEASLVSQIIG